MKTYQLGVTGHLSLPFQYRAVVLVESGHLWLDAILSVERKREGQHSHFCGHVTLSHSPLLLIGD